MASFLQNWLDKQIAISPDTPAKVGDDIDFAAREAYNLLRANLAFTLPDKEGGKIIAVTSSNPSEGKSFTIINLAYCLAKNGYRVLLVDADMRRPSIYETLNLPLTPGLSEALTGEGDAPLHEGVLNPNLSVLTAGTIPPMPNELLGSQRMKEFVETAASNYDYVLLDLPPVNSVSDPLVAATLIDGMIVVLKHDMTRRPEIIEAIRQLRFSKVRILGFVYNSFSRSAIRKYYDKKYYRRNSRYAYSYAPKHSHSDTGTTTTAAKK